MGVPVFFASCSLLMPASAQVGGLTLGGFVSPLDRAHVCLCIFAPPSQLLARAAMPFPC